jgi:hypothetical protein
MVRRCMAAEGWCQGELASAAAAATAPQVSQRAGAPGAEELGAADGVRVAAPDLPRRMVVLVPGALVEHRLGAVRVLTHQPSMAFGRSRPCRLAEVDRPNGQTCT